MRRTGYFLVGIDSTIGLAGPSTLPHARSQQPVGLKQPTLTSHNNARSHQLTSLSPTVSAYQRLIEAREIEWNHRIAKAEAAHIHQKAALAALIASEEATIALRTEQKLARHRHWEAAKRSALFDSMRRKRLLGSTLTGANTPDQLSSTDGHSLRGLTEEATLISTRRLGAEGEEEEEGTNSEPSDDTSNGFGGELEHELSAIVVTPPSSSTLESSNASMMPSRAPSSAFAAFAIERLKVLRHSTSSDISSLLPSAEVNQSRRTKAALSPLEARLSQLSLEFQLLPKNLRQVFEVMSGEGGPPIRSHQSTSSQPSRSNYSRDLSHKEDTFYQELEAFVGFTIRMVKELTHSGIIPPPTPSMASNEVEEVDGVLAAVLRIVPHEWMRMTKEEQHRWYPQRAIRQDEGPVIPTSQIEADESNALRIPNEVPKQRKKRAKRQQKSTTLPPPPPKEPLTGETTEGVRDEDDPLKWIQQHMGFDMN